MFSTMFRSLRHRNYRLFFGGQLISLIGTWMQSVAQSWLIYRLTHSTVLLGVAAFVGQFPGFLVAPFGGVVADRRDLRQVLILTQTSAMILAFLLAALTFAGKVETGHVLALGAAMGVVNAFDIPARQAIVVDLVGREDMVNAIALNSSVFNGARMIGPAVAGVLLAWAGEGWCFLLNALSYLAVIWGLWRMRLPARESRAGEPGRSTTAHIVEGFRYIGRTPPIRSLLILVGVSMMLGLPFASMLPVFAEDILHRGSSGLAGLTTGWGAGALLGALTLTLRKSLRGLSAWIALSCAGFGLSLIGFAYSRDYWLSVVMLVPVGFCMMVQLAACNTLIQSMVSDRLRGRVMAVYSMTFLGLSPLGALLEGLLAKPLGAPGAVALGGATCVLGAAVFWREIPVFREQARAMLGATGAATPPPRE